jgi:hypothetical protein
MANFENLGAAVLELLKRTKYHMGIETDGNEAEV